MALTKKSIVAEDPVEAADDDDPFADWDDGRHVAAGSQPAALPTTSRTATLADPLTTGLLAEVARRTATCELDPSEFQALRNTQEIDPEALRAAMRDAERSTTPPAHANTKPRK